MDVFCCAEDFYQLLVRKRVSRVAIRFGGEEGRNAMHKGSSGLCDFRFWLEGRTCGQGQL
jgi:hypothetical protein